MAIWKDKLRAAGIHLGLSLLVAALAAALVFGVWYPYPYREISGGRALFDLCAGFVYSQTLAACVELDLFAQLAAGAETVEHLAARGRLAPERKNCARQRPDMQADQTHRESNPVESNRIESNLAQLNRVGNRSVRRLDPDHRFANVDDRTAPSQRLARS